MSAGGRKDAAVVARTPDARRGASFWRWLHGLPRTTRRIVVAALVFGWLALWYVAVFAVRGAIGDGDVGRAEPLTTMIGPLIGVAVAFWLRRRAMGSFGRVWELDTAVRRRRLPDDADPAEWGPLLERAVGFQRGARSLALGLTVLSVVVVVIGFAWAGFGWIAVLAAALIGFLGVALLEVASRRQTQRIERLQDQVRDLPDRGPLTPGG